MRQRTISLTVALTASVVGVVSGTAFGQAPRATACAREDVAHLGPDSVPARGQGLAAAVGDRTLVVVEANGSRRAFATHTEGVVRHVAARAGSGTAYVLDRAGADAVVIQTSDGAIQLDQPGEATHPAWSPDGKLAWSLGSTLRIWSPEDGSTTTIAAPAPALAMFSPVFTSANDVVAVVGEAEPKFDRTEDEGLDNLWRYDLLTRRWSRVTAFRATGDGMLAVRTPIMRDDGSIEFVVVRGDASASMLPSFELWHMTSGGGVAKLRGLPREMYLAGVIGGQRVWNIFDEASGWRLFIQSPSDRLVDLGCGAVAVDPRSDPDLDRGTASRDDGPSPTATAPPTVTSIPMPSTSPTVVPDPVDGHVAGILVGDFGSVDAADQAAATIQQAFGGAAMLEVVDSVTAPNIVRPGVWAVVMLLPSDADVLGALGDFRSRLPEYEGWSWVVSA
jgi:hypothetical protein